MDKRDAVIGGTSVPWELQEIWQVQLELLDVFQAFCAKHELRYFMGFGTLLGAVRHHGFVPWDDDIDILMLRPDFERLKSLWQEFQSPYFLQSSLSEPAFWHRGMMKLRRDDTAFIEPLDWDKDFHQGIGLEILPLDVCAKDGPERQVQWQDIRRFQNLLWAKYYSIEGTVGGLGAAGMPMQKWLNLQVAAPQYSFEELETMLLEACRSHEQEETGTLAIFTSKDDENDFLTFAASDFAQTVTLDFAGRRVPAPIGYTQVLATVYDPSFMLLLPQAQRKPHHIAFWSWDESYSVWKHRFNDVFKDVEDKTIVLFGTGNMITDYERRTQGRFQPDFYVDNDKSKWGMLFHGREIRAPQALLDIPRDKLHLIICNIYYREIGAQLRQMGIKNYFIYAESLANLFREPTSIREKGRREYYNVGYVQGTFDLFHVGHLNLFRRAKEQCRYLIAGVVSDELNEVYKGARPYVPYEERAALVAACRYVDEVIKVDVGSDDKVKIWEEHHYDCHFCGDDHGNWEPLIKALHERGSEVEFFPYTESTSSTRIREELKKRILYHEDDVMSFDVFDTLVTRRVATPRGIFALVQERLMREGCVPPPPSSMVPRPPGGGQRTDIPERVRKGFFDMRWFYECKAREKWQKDGREDITLEEIYKCLGEAESLSEAQIQGLMKLELDVEARNLVGVEENIGQVKKLLASRHRVILISDMYLGEREIRSLLVTVDEVFRDLPIYSSADMEKGKWSGNGYRYVRQQEGLDIFHWVHTGDNKSSDIERAREMGIKTVYYNETALTRRERELMVKREAETALQLAVGGLRLRRLQGEDVSLDALPGLPDEQKVPFGLANGYPVGVLADKVALYGAGKFGRDLHEKMRAMEKEIVCWVDKRNEVLREQGLPVEPMERLCQGGFEQVVIAVKNQETADEIGEILVSMGIGRELIFWM